MAETTSERIAAILAEILGIPVEAAAKANRETVGEWDSVAHVNVIFALEDEFGVTFAEEQMSELDSIPAIVTAVEALRGDQ